MGKSALDLIGVVEAAYRLEGDEETWLGGALDALAPGLVEGRGVCAAVFDREASDPRAILTSVVNRGMNGELMALMRAGFEHGTPSDRDRSLRLGGPTMRFSAIAGMPLVTHPVFGPLARDVGFDDLVVLRAMNPDGVGVFFAAPIPAQARKLPRWAELSAHIAAGLRLRRGATKLSAPDAVFTPGGKVVEASGAAVDARAALREAVRRIDRARSAAGRRDGEASVDAWTALVEGRWSLVDHFESDGRRFVCAVENRPEALDPRALTSDERPVLHLVAMGHTNKLIAYELGLPAGTVATRLASIMRKLGVRSRVEIVDRYVALRSATFAPLSHEAREWKAGVADVPSPSAAVLTPAEAEVVAQAVRGASNERIARARGSSPRTVANLLASAYRKLGVRSRAELSSLSGRPASAVTPPL